MAEADRRRVMTDAEFDAIPAEYAEFESPVDNYYDALILSNGRIGEAASLDGLGEGLTAGQQMLIQVRRFERQVMNGGVAQFFWNCDGFAPDMAEWFGALGLTDLRASYERALGELAGDEGRWLALRAERSCSGGNPMLEAFQQALELLDLEWFDDDYFGRHRYNERGEWVFSPGLRDALRARLVEYVRDHRAEFITG